MKRKLTRREVVLAGGLGVAGGVAASLPARSAAAPAATGDGGSPEADLRVLGDLLSTEHVLEYAYRRVLRSWSFNSSTRGVLELVLHHETEHADVLAQHRAALAGGLSPSAQGAGRGSSALSGVASMLSDARTPREALQVLSKVESLAEANYFRAIGELQSPQLAVTASQILASEAQHWSLLLNVLTEGKLPQVAPDAFVRGVASIS